MLTDSKAKVHRGCLRYGVQCLGKRIRVAATPSMVFIDQPSLYWKHHTLQE